MNTLELQQGDACKIQCQSFEGLALFGSDHQASLKCVAVIICLVIDVVDPCKANSMLALVSPSGLQKCMQAIYQASLGCCLLSGTHVRPSKVHAERPKSVQTTSRQGIHICNYAICSLLIVMCFGVFYLYQCQ